MHESEDTVTLAIGPLNTAGQGFQWAEACQKFAAIEAFSFAGTRKRARRIDGQPHQRSLHHRVRPSFLKTARMERILRGTTHLLNESFTTLTGAPRSQDFTYDLRRLVNRGITSAVLFHGSDIRSPERHIDSEPFSFYRLMTPDEVEGFEREAADRRRRASDTDLPLFVSTPDLLQDLPDATWLPLVVDLSAWATEDLPFRRERIRVLHVPSRRQPPIKGTGFVDPVLNQLTREGLVEYVSPLNIPHEHMPKLVKSVDIVIDQILSGSYGVTAVEAMAAGRLVIGHLGPTFRHHVDADIPILDVAPEQLEETLRTIVREPAAYVEFAGRGPRYAHRFHSGHRSSAVLTGWILGHEIHH
jgi:hypothetical protein